MLEVLNKISLKSIEILKHGFEQRKILYSCGNLNEKYDSIHELQNKIL